MKLYQNRKQLYQRLQAEGILKISIAMIFHIGLQATFGTLRRKQVLVVV